MVCKTGLSRSRNWNNNFYDLYTSDNDDKAIVIGTAQLYAVNNPVCDYLKSGVTIRVRPNAIGRCKQYDKPGYLGKQAPLNLHITTILPTGNVLRGRHSVTSMIKWTIVNEHVKLQYLKRYDDQSILIAGWYITGR